MTTPIVDPSELAPGVPEARPAATVMLVRDACSSGGEVDGVEVFVLERAAASVFAAGFYVFPGGKVDPADSSPDVEQVTDGFADDEASALLDVEAGGLAYWVAAIRECFEEAGVLLARTADGELADGDPTDRMQVYDGTLPLVELCQRDGLTLTARALRYVAHWVTPVAERPRRFDTRFFLAAVPADQVGGHDDGETVSSRWVRPAEALALADAGELLLMPPTRACLATLAAAASAADALARADAAEPPRRILPTFLVDDAGTVTGVDADGETYPITGLR